MIRARRDILRPLRDSGSACSSGGPAAQWQVIAASANSVTSESVAAQHRDSDCHRDSAMVTQAGDASSQCQ